MPFLFNKKHDLKRIVILRGQYRLYLFVEIFQCFLVKEKLYGVGPLLPFSFDVLVLEFGSLQLFC